MEHTKGTAPYRPPLDANFELFLFGLTVLNALLRARAIENLSYVFAPAMCGDHPGNRMTYGHSLIVDPWGKILAELGAEPGVAVADIDPAKVVRVRGMLPALEHDRNFGAPTLVS